MSPFRTLAAIFVVAFWSTVLFATLASRSSSGTYSLPSGNPVVTGSTISSTVHNNTNSDIATELTNSLDRQGRGAMLAPLQLVNGTAASPAAAFGSDTDTGLYRIGANNPAVAVAGVKVQEWLTTGSGISGSLFLGDAVALTAPDVPNLSLLSASSQFRLYMKDGRGATGNKVGRIVYDGSSLSAGTGNLPHPGWQFQATDDTGAFTVGGPNVYRGGNPASTLGFTDYLTRTNMVKVWAQIDTNGASASTVLDGFNVASVSEPGSNVIRVTVADDFATANYAAVVSNDTGFNCYTSATATTHFDVLCRVTTDSSAVNPAVTNFNIHVIAIGAQ